MIPIRVRVSQTCAAGGEERFKGEAWADDHSSHMTPAHVPAFGQQHGVGHDISTVFGDAFEQ